jgi:hypothetical protein
LFRQKTEEAAMRGWVLTGAALALAACGGEKPAANVATPEEATVPANGGGVAREDVSATPTPSPTPTAAAIQQQTGPYGSQVSLTRAAVTGDVLTIQLSYDGGKPYYSYIPVDRVSVIDDATAQQLSILKDGQGNALAAPLGSDGKQVRAATGQGAPSVVWFKFPAPPATSRTVSINIPEVGPFDGVPVTR